MAPACLASIPLFLVSGLQVRYDPQRRLCWVCAGPQFTFFNTGMLDKPGSRNFKETLQLADREQWRVNKSTSGGSFSVFTCAFV